MARQDLYTLRWIINNKWGDSSYKGVANQLVSQEIGDWVSDSPLEPDRPNLSSPNGKLLYCPFAEQDFPESRIRGHYRKGYPEGAIVHFTAGRRNGLKNGMAYQVNQGYTYFVIDADGNIGQNFSLDSWGYHAGSSFWPNFGPWVSKYFVGIEIQCAGKLNGQGKSWFGKTYSEEDTRRVDSSENIKKGQYLKYTPEQEEALIRLLLWLKNNNTEVFDLNNVLGHDEVSPDRKNDPGGSLSTSMPKFRQKLLAEYSG